MRKYKQALDYLREKCPLVHQITNYVTVNDCANITLAIGASPIMADDINEVAEIAQLSQAVVLNIGTLNQIHISAMIEAGKAANQKQIPVILDPVGAGASHLRSDTVQILLSEIQFTVIRGNISEMLFLAGLQAQIYGVDAGKADITPKQQTLSIAQNIAKTHHCTAVITGACDIVADQIQAAFIHNGHPMMANITGTGCMSTALIGSFCGANPDLPFDSAVAALLVMGIAGEIAHKQAGHLGNGSFRAALHDAVSQMTTETLVKMAKFNDA
ncbi:hydroxyethylthiazole kinase [Stenoxybacter acetivorans]|uniref:hydroxyethylthiazole kinase n=1 Tax=Stenoxybacter acetivorans TaxID=422441 RepID=UPI00056A93E6|nr:hydroxyethylthiazole kinase [Stenoxybacter acetivorans]